MTTSVLHSTPVYPIKTLRSALQQSKQQERESLEEREAMQEKMKAKKGWLAVIVGIEDDDLAGEGFHRFMIPISYLYHPQFRRLLEDAHEIYRYHVSGPLKLPCSVDDFLHIRWLIERESVSSGAFGRSRSHQQQERQRRHQFHSASFSFHSC